MFSPGPPATHSGIWNPRDPQRALSSASGQTARQAFSPLVYSPPCPRQVVREPSGVGAQDPPRKIHLTFSPVVSEPKQTLSNGSRLFPLCGLDRDTPPGLPQLSPFSPSPTFHILGFSPQLGWRRQDSWALPACQSANCQPPPPCLCNGSPDRAVRGERTLH